MLREIVLDTETTGIDPAAGDRIVEIGCVELVNHFPTGRTFHAYSTRSGAMPQGASPSTGCRTSSWPTSRSSPRSPTEFVDFVGDGRLVIHNAAFDIGFLNAEFARTGHPPLDHDRVVDTLSLARRKHPGAPNSLDALCARYGIDNSRRTKHGALLDAEILAEVYIELIGGKQADLGLVAAAAGASRPQDGRRRRARASGASRSRASPRRSARPTRPSSRARRRRRSGATTARRGPKAGREGGQAAGSA